MSRAFIVWNEDRSEGVIFVEDSIDQGPHVQNAEQDAEQAATGNRSAMATSSLAEAFNDLYGDDECPYQVIADVGTLYLLS